MIIAVYSSLHAFHLWLLIFYKQTLLAKDCSLVPNPNDIAVMLAGVWFDVFDVHWDKNFNPVWSHKEKGGTILNKLNNAACMHATTASMHHEVLLALSGYPGNTFAVSRDSGLFEVSKYVFFTLEQRQTTVKCNLLCMKLSIPGGAKPALHSPERD